MTARRAWLAPSFALSLFLAMGCGGGGDGGGGGGDATPPTIVSVSPADLSTGVARGTAVVVTFSEPIAASSVTASTIVWQRAGGGAVAFSAGVSGAVVTLTQSSPPLAEYGQYTVQITTGVTDAAGNALPAAQARTVGFRTVDDVAPAAPGAPAGPGAYSPSTGVAFSWTAASDAGSGVASYWLQVATATDGSGTTIFDGANGTALSRTVTVADGQTAFARVKAIDGAGNETWSAWSSGVLVDATPPVVGAVSDAGAWSGSSVALSWAAAADPAPGSGLVAGHTLQVATSPDPGSVVETLPSAGTSDTYYATSTVSWPEGAYLYARIGAADLAGNTAWGAWSDGVRIDRTPPSPSAPADAGAYATSTSVGFGWAAATDAGSGVASYWLQVATATDGSGATLFDGSNGAALSRSVTVADGQRAFARVKAIDAVGNEQWSGWSDGILVDATPPVVPGAVSDGGAWSGSSVALSWAAASDPAPGSGLVAGYTLQVATAPDAGSVVEALPAPATSETYYATSAISWPEGAYLYARVGAADLAGNSAFGGWSDGVRIDRTGPAFAAAPSDPGDFGPAVLRFQWSPAGDSGSGVVPGDLIEVATAPDAGSVFATASGVSSPRDVDVTGLADGTTVYARVTSWDAVGNPGTSAWSDGVILDTRPPTSPGTPTDDGARQRSLSATFQWAASTDTLSGLAGYTVQVATAADGTGILATQSVATTSFTYAYGGATPATLHARVLATDAVGNATAYGPWSDGIVIDPTVVATPTAPTDGGAYSASTSLSFSWSPVAGATGYLVEIGTAPGLSDVLAATAATSPFVHDVAPAALPNGTTYYARVAAVDAGGPGGWSDASDGITVDVTAPGAPGTPLDRGAVDDRFVTFTWTPADDPESGVPTYEIEVLADGSPVLTSAGAPTTATFDAAGRNGQTIAARVRAMNGAGTWGPWSGPSDGVVVDTLPPALAGRSPGDGQPGVPTNVDVVYTFTEPMDRASVEAAFTLSCGAGCPRNGLAFTWNAASTQVTIVPDTADPAGATNADLLPESTPVGVTLAATATDAAGNPLASPDTLAFSTGDETAPRVIDVQAGGFQSPVPASVTASGPFAVMAIFDEPMDPTQGRMSVSGRFGWVDSWFQQTAIQSAAPTGGGEVTYTLFGCPGIQQWDLVTVRFANPPSFDVTRAPVTAVGQVGSDCTFTVANPTGDVYLGGGSVAYPVANGGRIAWTSPTTLQILLDPRVTLPPSSEVRVEVNSVSDVAGNWTWAQRTLQVAAAPGTDAVAPYLFSASPRHGDSGVLARSPILLRFSEPMDVSSLAGAYAVDDAGAQYEMSYGDEMLGSTLVFVPRKAAPELTTVTVHVPASARDLAGNALAAPIDLSFEVAARTDFTPPVVLDVNPPSGLPVDDVWAASFNLLDGSTGQLELADTTSVGPEDVRVVDSSTGLLVRGWRPRAEAGSGSVSIDPPARGGLSTGNASTGIASASAAGGVASLVTTQPHGLLPGARVWVYGTSDGCFSVASWEGAPVLSVGGPASFTLATGCPDGATATGGWASFRTARSFEFVVPAPEGGDVLDFAGNSMTPRSFVVAMTPAPTNRAPTIESLRDLRIGASTSPLGRTLELELRVRDPEDDPVTVSVTSQGGAIPFPSMTRVLTGTRYSAEYRYSANGPPGVADPPELNDANFPASGYYPFEITVEDAASSTTFVRQVWVWAPSDLPANDGVDDGGTLRPYDATRPIVVETTASPGFRWQGVDLSHADFLALQIIELTPGLGSGDPENQQAVPLATPVTSSSLPAPLEPSLYAWFLNEYRFAPGEIDPRTQGWSLDFGNLLGNTAVYGPANRSFAATEFGAARTAISGTGPGATFSGSSGLYAIEASPGSGSAPVAVAQALTRNDGTPASAAEWFAAAGDGRFMVTSTDPAMGLPLAYRGLHGRGGRLFAVAGGGQQSGALEIGVRRDPALDFGGGIAGTTFAFVQAETRVNAGLFQVGASVGEAVAGATDLAVSLTSHLGTSDGPFPVPYTVAADGFLRIDVSGGAGLEYASGWLGGEAGAVLGALAGDSSADLSFLLLLAERHAWAGTEDAAMIAGTYRLAEYGAATDGAGQIAEAHASNGVITFDGAGGFSYAVASGGALRTGTGTYAVDPVAERVTLVSDPGTPDETTFLLAVAPDPDTLLGVSVSSPDRPQVLVLGR